MTKWLSERQLAHALGLEVNHVHALCAAGRMPSKIWGSGYRISSTALEQWLESLSEDDVDELVGDAAKREELESAPEATTKTRRPRRPRGDGSIYQRKDGRWAGAVVVDGRTVYRYGATKDEARRKLDQVKRDRDAGLPLVSETVTVAQFAAEWLASIGAHVRPATVRRYRQYFDVHIVPDLGKTRLAKLTASQVQRLYSALLHDKGLSGTTVRNIHQAFHGMLKAAVRLGLVQRNVTEMVSPPRRAEHEMHVLLPDQIRTFLAAAEGERLEALFVLALATGMRVGELLALQWRDIDLEAGSLQVRATLQWQDGDGWVRTPPKTARGRRRIRLPAAAVRTLLAHRERQAKERAALRDAWHDEGFVFPNTIGMPLDRTHMVVWSFRPVLKRAGLPPMRFHDLRHTAATMMLLANVHPKVVSEVLGHATISMTLDIYSHVLPDMQEDAARVMDGVLGSQLGERVLRQMAPRLLEGEKGDGE